MDRDIATKERLQELVRRIVEAGRPERIILFGRRARGDSHPDSDVDLLVIQRSSVPRYRRSAPIRRRGLTAILPSKDIVVYTPEEVEAWSDVPNAFVTTAVREGKILYEK